MELKFKETEADPPVEADWEVECPGCRTVIDSADAVHVDAFEKGLCRKCASFWTGEGTFECPCCRTVIDQNDAVFVPEVEKDLCPDCAAFLNSNESIDTVDPPEDVAEETDHTDNTAIEPIDIPEFDDDGEPSDEEPQENVAEETAPDPGKEETTPHADWPIPLNPDEIKRLQPVAVAELVARVKEKFPLAHYHAREILQVKAIRGADICRKALHHMNAWYRNSGPGKSETQTEAQNAYENTMGG